MKPSILIAFLWIAGPIQLTLTAQHFVPLEPLNRNAIYEEFTGVKCPNCPSGHQVLAQILAANPGRAFAVAYHPFNSSYTTPYTGDPDFRRHYADSLYMTPYCGTSRYMPSAFVQRREWSPPERLTERSNWAAYGTTVMGEASPLNVGMATSYDESSQALTVTVDVWYTADVTGSHNLMVTLAENNLESQQSGATGTYVHKHTFREAFTGQWGDPLCEDPAAGSMYRKQFVFSNTLTGYDMDNCELMAFVVDNSTEEVVSGIGCMAGDTTYITPDISLAADTLFFRTVAQCTAGQSAVLRNLTTVPLDILEVQPASMIPGQINWVVDPWPFTTFPHTLLPGDSVVLNVRVNLPVNNTLAGFYLDSLFIATLPGKNYLMIAVDQDLYTSTGGSTAITGARFLGVSPNPVIESAGFDIFLTRAEEVSVELTDLCGKAVRSFSAGKLETGRQKITWDGCDHQNKRVADGFYIYRLKAGPDIFTGRIAVVR